MFGLKILHASINASCAQYPFQVGLQGMRVKLGVRTAIGLASSYDGQNKINFQTHIEKDSTLILLFLSIVLLIVISVRRPYEAISDNGRGCLQL